MIFDHTGKACLRPRNPTRPSRTPPRQRTLVSLALGIALFAAMAYALGRLGSGSMAGSRIAEIENSVAGWFHALRTPESTTAAHLVTELGSTTWVTSFTMIAALGFAWARRWYALLALGLTVPGGMALNIFLKASFHRPRPAATAWSEVFSGYGFPSGHTMAATLLYGALAILVCGALVQPRGRLGVLLGAGVLIGLVGWSRLQLGAHFLSDVLGAFAASLAWLGLGFAAVAILRKLLRPVGPLGHGAPSALAHRKSPDLLNKRSRRSVPRKIQFRRAADTK